MKKYVILFLVCLLLDFFFKLSNSYLILCEPVTAAALLGGASLLSSIFGGLFGSGNNSATNATNLQIARETNEQNYRMFHEQQDFAERMYNAANEYNSPLQQAERLRAAGINPSAVLGSTGQGVTAASAPASPSPNPAVAAHMLPYDYSPMFDGISRSIGSFLVNQNQDIDNKMKSIDLSFKMQEKRQELENKKAEYGEILSRKDLNDSQRSHYRKLIEQLDQNISLIDVTYNDLVAQSGLNTDILRGQRDSIRIQNDIANLQKDFQSWQNEYQKKYGDKQLEQLDALIKEVYSSVNLNNKNAAAAVANKLESEARKRGIVLDNEHKQELLPLLREAQRLENESARKHIRQQGSDYWNPFRYLGQSLGGTAAGAALRFIPK